MISRNRYVCAVEIGTEKVVAVLAQFSRAPGFSLLGQGQCPSRGVIKGVVVDYKTASSCVHDALEQAELAAGVRLDEVWLAQSGGHLDGFQNQEGVNVSAANRMVSALDMATVCQLAKARHLPEGRTVVHHLRRPYRLDEHLLPDPEHHTGSRLEVGYWTVHGRENQIADHLHVISGYNVCVNELILSSLASGRLLTSENDRSQGALVLDLGAGTTDYVLYREGCAFLTGVLPVGGQHLTNDLSLGLRLNNTHFAEKLKLRHGRAVVTAKDKSEKVWLHGDLTLGDCQFPRLTIEQITAARAREIFEVVRQKLGPDFDPERVPAGVILTGGASRLPGLDEAAAAVFGVPVRFGEPPAWVEGDLRSPVYSTVLGLLCQGSTGSGDEPPPPRRGPRFFGKLFSGIFTL